MNAESYIPELVLAGIMALLGWGVMGRLNSLVKGIEDLTKEFHDHKEQQAGKLAKLEAESSHTSRELSSIKRRVDAL